MAWHLRCLRTQSAGWPEMKTLIRNGAKSRDLREIRYRFSAFMRTIYDLPSAEILPTLKDYTESIEWDLSRRNVKKNEDVQKILAFCEAFKTQALPSDLSPTELSLYLRTTSK